jgi:hypothetical protein
MNQLYETMKSQGESMKNQGERLGAIEHQLHALLQVMAKKEGLPLDSLVPPPPPPAPMSDAFTQHASPGENQESEAKSQIGNAPGSHSTGAHYLMSKWSVIREFFNDCHITSPDYVIDLIENDGQLLPYGQTSSGKAKVEASNRLNERLNNFRGGSSINPEHSYKYIPPLDIEDENFEPTYKKVRNISIRCKSGLVPDGDDLQLDSRLLKHYFNSFMEHIWSIHPICSHSKLKTMMQSFMDKYSPLRGYHDSPVPPYNVSPQTGDKRKHHLLEEIIPSTSRPRATVVHSLENAMVLMILALGVLCSSDEFLMQESLPQYPPHPNELQNLFSEMKGQQEQQYQQQYHETPSIPHNSHSSPSYAKHSPPAGVMHSPESFDTVKSMHSPASHTMRSVPSPSGTYRDQYQDHPTIIKQNTKFNVQKVPGLAYFNLAAKILGEWVGSRDLMWLQTQILAALYWGQIGDVLKSFGYVKPAADLMCEIIHRNYDEFILVHSSNNVGRDGDKRRNHVNELIRIIFWSLYQLESDIRAELDHLMASGLEKMAQGEGDKSMSWPPQVLPGCDRSIRTIELFGKTMPVLGLMDRFTGQFYLRKLLNSTHSAVYGQPDPSLSLGIPARELSDAELWGRLQQWRLITMQSVSVPTWRDEDPVSMEWSVARLRGKFYGGAYIMNRPYLYKALYPTPEDVQEMAKDPFRYDLLEQQTLDSKVDITISTGSRNCILAALYSTEAFDGLLTESPYLKEYPYNEFVKRPKFTNVYGTLAA